MRMQSSWPVRLTLEWTCLSPTISSCTNLTFPASGLSRHWRSCRCRRGPKTKAPWAQKHRPPASAGGFFYLLGIWGRGFLAGLQVASLRTEEKPSGSDAYSVDGGDGGGGLLFERPE